MKKLERVFFIDDEEVNSFLNQRLFRKMGYDLIFRAFMNGRDAFLYLEELNKQLLNNPSHDYQPPDLILLDVNMPVMDGFEFVEMYETLPAALRDRIVLVLLSTSGHPIDTVKAKKLSLPYLIKPLTAEKLQPILQEHFQ